MGIAIRVFLEWRNHLPVHFRIDPISALYVRNGETDPTHGRNWNWSVWKYRLRRKVSGRGDSGLLVRVWGFTERCGADPRIVFYERKGETAPIDEETGTLLSGYIDYARRFLGSLIRVFFLWCKHLGALSGIDPRIVLYERNEEKEPIDGGPGLRLELDCMEISITPSGSWAYRFAGAF